MLLDKGVPESFSTIHDGIGIDRGRADGDTSQQAEVIEPRAAVLSSLRKSNA